MATKYKITAREKNGLWPSARVGKIPRRDLVFSILPAAPVERSKAGRARPRPAAQASAIFRGRGFVTATFDGEGIACRRGHRLVLADLAFAAAAGGAVLLTGPNGSGKTSLLRLMAGLGRPAAGRLRWSGADIALDPAAHSARLRYMGHLDAVKPQLTVAENLLSWSRIKGSSDAAALTALDEFGIAGLAGLPARILSAGQKRRLALARAFAAAALLSALWLLDEPTIALDPAGIAALGQAIARARAAGGIVIVSTNVAFDLPGAATLDMADFAPPVAILDAA